jgi:phage/plasmid-associated DNA primase
LSSQRVGLEAKLSERDQRIQTLMAEVALQQKAEILKVEKEVKFTVAQLGDKRRRDLKKVGNGIFSCNWKGKEFMVLVQIVTDELTNKQSTVVVYEDEKGNNRCIDLQEFLTMK